MSTGIVPSDAASGMCTPRVSGFELRVQLVMHVSERFGSRVERLILDDTEARQQSARLLVAGVVQRLILIRCRLVHQASE